MTEHQLLLPEGAGNTFETVEQLDVLCGQHAILTEELRRLQLKNLLIAESGEWRHLKTEVLRLRAEFESFKQSQTTFALDALILTDHEDTVN